MDQEKIGKFIKELRKSNNLTQEAFASMFNVTYQAVSKWENGKNIPDISTLKQMSKKFNIDISDLLDGKKTKKQKRWLIIIPILIVIILVVFVAFYFNKDNFEFKQIQSSCSKFSLTGSMAYNKDKTAIYISSIDYCGKKDDTIYDKIECKLYENYKGENSLISNCGSKKNLTIEKFLKGVNISVDSYSAMCKKFNEESLYIELIFEKDGGMSLSHKIPLSLKENC